MDSSNGWRVRGGSMERVRDGDGGELSDNNILLGVVGVHVLALHTDEMLTG